MSGKKTNDTGQKPLPEWYDGDYVHAVGNSD